MRTLIDGYNLLYAFPPLRRLMIARHSDSARRGLIGMIGKLMRSGAFPPPVTIVFDGRAAPRTAEAVEAAGLTVRFAPAPDSADQLIGDIVEHGQSGHDPEGDFTVVSSDREVAVRCRRLGAKVMRVKDFIEKYVPEREPRRLDRFQGPTIRPRSQMSPIGRSEEETTEVDPRKIRGRLPEFEVERWLEEFGLGGEK